MQSPCLHEASKLCPHGCCPNPLFLGMPVHHRSAVKKNQSTLSVSRRDFAARTASSIFPDRHFTNPESLPSLEESYTEFINACPIYAETYKVDQIREKEYYHLSDTNHICLDYIGIGLFSYSQVQRHDPANQFVSNSNSSSSFTQSSDIPFFSVSYKMGNLKTQLLHGGHESELESAMKKRIMDFLNVSESDYSMVFTANRTSAFKLLAESYPFQSSKQLLTVYDHESEAVETMVNSSEKKGARVMSAEFSWPRLRIVSTKLRKMVVRKKKKKKKRGLFVFPLHSRVTGAKYPYLWMHIARENGWHILVDACALGPKDMDSFGLSLIRPDFLICSFYKIFAFNPSGFGCLFVKKSTVPFLEDSTCAGMVTLLPAKKQLCFLDESSDIKVEYELTSKTELHESPFDTSSSGAIPSETRQTSEATTSKKEKLGIICRGLDQVDSLGLTRISNRRRCLINWLVTALRKLKHPNTETSSLIKLYGPRAKFDRGPALAFNVFDWKGEKLDSKLVQKLADRNNITLGYEILTNITFSDKYKAEKGNVRETQGGGGSNEGGSKRRGKKQKRGITVVTIALGFLANFEDAYTFWRFFAQFLDADFVEKAKWRYTGLNQQTIEVL